MPLGRAICEQFQEQLLVMENKAQLFQHTTTVIHREFKLQHILARVLRFIHQRFSLRRPMPTWTCSTMPTHPRSTCAHSRVPRD